MLHFINYFQKPCVFYSYILDAFNVTLLVQLGSVFHDASAVYFHCWCAMFECDGPSLMCFNVFGIFWASVGHVTSHTGAGFY